jgi:hypothetical protein
MAAEVEEPKPYVEPEPAKAAVATTTTKPAVVAIPKAAPKVIFVDSEPPDPIWEEMPKAPGPNYVWTKGYWHWTGAKWTWHHGAWRVREAGLVYVPAHYELVNGRVVYRPAHWDRKVVPVSYGGKVVVVKPAVRPATFKPGTYVVVRDALGHRIGTRPVKLYRPAPKATEVIVVPPPPPRHRRPGVGPGHPVPPPPGHPVAVPGHPGKMMPPPHHGKVPPPPPPHHGKVAPPPPHHGKVPPPPPPHKRHEKH